MSFFPMNSVHKGVFKMHTECKYIFCSALIRIMVFLYTLLDFPPNSWRFVQTTTDRRDQKMLVLFNSIPKVSQAFIVSLGWIYLVWQLNCSPGVHLKTLLQHWLNYRCQLIVSTNLWRHDYIHSFVNNHFKFLSFSHLFGWTERIIAIWSSLIKWLVVRTNCHDDASTTIISVYCGQFKHVELFYEIKSYSNLLQLRVKTPRLFVISVSAVVRTMKTKLTVHMNMNDLFSFLLHLL